MNCHSDNLRRIPRPIKIENPLFEQIKQCLPEGDIDTLRSNGIQEIWYLGEDLMYGQRMDDKNIQDGGHINFRYKVISNLGRGSFGTVMKAFDYKDQVEVAIKLGVPKDDSVTWNEFKRLEGIHQAKRPGSEHIVEPTDIFRFRGSLIIVYPLRQGSLNDIIKSNQKAMQPSVDWSGLQHFADRMVRALICLHGHGIVHCDIKPANILFYTRSGNEDVSKLSTEIVTELADFGLATDRGKGVYSGTRHYIPPEFQANGAKRFPRNSDSDMFALGMTLMDLYSNGKFNKNGYFGLTKLPSAEMEILKFIETSILSYHSEIPKEDRVKFFHFISGCLALDPQKRLRPEHALKLPFFQAEI